MQIRRAKITDIYGLNKLLMQVLMVHHYGRPDLFKANVKKYTDEELIDIIISDDSPIFVAVDDNEEVLGYAFCKFIQHVNNNIFTDIKIITVIDAKILGKRNGFVRYMVKLCKNGIESVGYIGKYYRMLRVAKRHKCKIQYFVRAVGHKNHIGRNPIRLCALFREVIGFGVGIKPELASLFGDRANYRLRRGKGRFVGI